MRVLLPFVLVVAGAFAVLGSTTYEVQYGYFAQVEDAHCGCPASKGECSMPCSSCCAPVCTQFQPDACHR